MKNNITLILAICILIPLIYFVFIYSLKPRYEAFKTKNYDCIFVQDAYCCMQMKGGNQ